MDRIELHGVRLEVAHIPGKPELAPLVFLHEGLGSVAMWTQRGLFWPEALCRASGRAGWLFSRRGYGQSDPVADVRGASRMDGFWHIGRHETDYLHREAFEVLPLLLSRLGLRAPVLVGHSDGASIALLYASRHPVAGCVAMAPHAFVEDVSIHSISQARDQYLTTHDDPRGLRQRLARYHRDVDNAFWQWNDIWLDPAFRAFDILGACAGIRAPLLLVQGEQDEYGTLQQLHRVREQARHADILTLKDCGHSPHRDKPHELTEALEHWFRSSITA